MPKVSKNVKTRPVLNLCLSLLVTPLNLLVIGLKVLWSGRRIRIASVAVLIALMVTATFRFAPLAPMADFVRQQTYTSTAAIGFKINDVTVEGRQRTQRSDLQAAVDLAIGMPIFAVDLNAMRHNIESLPWVREAVVIRQLPNIVHIKLVEREAFALFRTGETLTLIDKRGDHITEHHLRPFAHLPVFSGEGAHLRAADLLDLLYDYPVLRNRMTAAHWTGGRRWTLKLDHGGEVHLPEREITGALDRLMDLERQKRILAIENQAIDLRLPDRVLLRVDRVRSDRVRKISDEVRS